MNLPIHYLHLKNIFNLVLFDDINIDEDFREINKAAISTNFIKYHREYKRHKEHYDNLYLKLCIKKYLANIDKSKKSEIVQIVKENTDLGFVAFLIASDNNSKLKNFQIDSDFVEILSDYVKSEYETPNFLILFFMQLFSNFDYIDIEKYDSYKLTRDQYFVLLSKHLPPHW